MKYFLDSNVILDYLLKREGYELAKSIIEEQVDTQTGRLGAGCFYSIVFVMEKELKAEIKTKRARAEQIRELYFDLRQHVSVAPITEELLDTAFADIRFLDIEDALQYHCAIAAGCSYLISFNVKDFPDVGEIKIIHPSEFGKE